MSVTETLNVQYAIVDELLFIVVISHGYVRLLNGIDIVVEAHRFHTGIGGNHLLVEVA